MVLTCHWAGIAKHGDMRDLLQPMPLAGDSVSSAKLNPPSLKPMPLPAEESPEDNPTLVGQDDLKARKSENQRLRLRVDRVASLRYDASSTEQGDADQRTFPKLSRDVIIFFLVGLAAAGMAWFVTY
jgi:hypothetical protein